MRDPRVDPREGDILRESTGERKLIVDWVDDEEIYWRVFDGNGGLLCALKMSVDEWKEEAHRKAETIGDES